jgi:hypothetical protein
MGGRDLRRYLGEVRRVLRPGGRCLMSCFLLDEPVRELIRSGKSQWRLEHPAEGGWALDPALPESAIGYDADTFRSWVADAGFLAQVTYEGSWCGCLRAPYQDVVVATRP